MVSLKSNGTHALAASAGLHRPVPDFRRPQWTAPSLATQGDWSSHPSSAIDTLRSADANTPAPLFAASMSSRLPLLDDLSGQGSAVTRSTVFSPSSEYNTGASRTPSQPRALGWRRTYDLERDSLRYEDYRTRDAAPRVLKESTAYPFTSEHEPKPSTWADTATSLFSSLSNLFSTKSRAEQVTEEWYSRYPETLKRTTRLQWAEEDADDRNAAQAWRSKRYNDDLNMARYTQASSIWDHQVAMIDLALTQAREWGYDDRKTEKHLKATMDDLRHTTYMTLEELMADEKRNYRNRGLYDSSAAASADYSTCMMRDAEGGNEAWKGYHKYRSATSRMMSDLTVEVDHRDQGEEVTWDRRASVESVMAMFQEASQRRQANGGSTSSASSSSICDRRGPKIKRRARTSSADHETTRRRRSSRNSRRRRSKGTNSKTSGIASSRNRRVHSSRRSLGNSKGEDYDYDDE